MFIERFHCDAIKKKIENHLFNLCLEILLKTRLEEILVGKFR